MTGRAGAAMQSSSKYKYSVAGGCMVWCPMPIGQRKMKVVGGYILNSNQRERNFALPPGFLLGCIASKKSQYASFAGL